MRAVVPLAAPCRVAAAEAVAGTAAARCFSASNIKTLSTAMQPTLPERVRRSPASSVVCLLSSGYEDDLLAAQELPGLDVIVGGHSHTFLYTPTSAGPIVARGPGVNASNCVAKVCQQRECTYSCMLTRIRYTTVAN